MLDLLQEYRLKKGRGYMTKFHFVSGVGFSSQTVRCPCEASQNIGSEFKYHWRLFLFLNYIDYLTIVECKMAWVLQ